MLNHRQSKNNIYIWRKDIKPAQRVLVEQINGTLKEHMITKHEDTQFKDGNDKMSNFNDLLYQYAKHLEEEQVEAIGEQVHFRT